MRLQQLTLFFVLVGIVALVRLPFGPLSESTLEKIEGAMRERGIPLDIGDAALVFPSTVEIRKAGALFPLPAFPLPIAVDMLEAKLRLWPLFMLRSAGDFDARLYSGALRGNISWPLVGKRYSFDITGDRLNLGSHPALRAMGVDLELDLRASAEGELFRPDHFPVETGKLRLLIHHADIPEGLRSPWGIPLPPLSGIEGDMAGTANGQELELERLNLSSSAGSIKGEGQFELAANGALSSATAEFNVDLTDEGKRTIGGYLALAAQRSPDNPPKKWRIVLDKSTGRKPRWTVSPEGR